MKHTPINSSSRAVSKRVSPLAASVAIMFAVVVPLMLWPSAATMQSSLMRSELKLSLFEPAVLIPSQTTTFYLHGTGPVNNPPTLFINTTAPTASAEKYKDSSSINRNNGNPWTEVGAWPATAASTTGPLTSLSDLHVWLGLKNSDDQGTNFDLRVEAYKNSTLVTSGQSLCVTGVTRNPNNAKEVVVGFDTFSAVSFDGTSDVLKLRILTRVGTNAAGGSCGGHNNAVGLRLYFDALARASRFDAVTGSSDTTAPVLTVDQPVDNLITSANQINVTGSFTDQSPTSITVNGVAASLQGNNFSASISLVEGANTLHIVATDSSANQSQATRNVTRDTIAPIAVVTPEKTITNAAQVSVTVVLTETSPASVTVNGITASLSGVNFTATVPLVEGINPLLVIATDAAGNQSQTTQAVTRDSIAPVLTVTNPVDGLVTNVTVVNVFGTVTDSTAVTVSINESLMVPEGNAFGGQVELSDGVHQLHVLATDAAGNQTEVVRNVTADSTDPIITELTPVPDTLIEATSATIQGRVTDATTVTVTVGTVTATVNAQGLFTAANVPIVEGDNELKITAVDVAGNQGETELSLKGKDLTPPASPVLFATSSPTKLTFQSIEGRAEPGTKIRITGGVEPVETTAAFGSGLFIANVKLNVGPNALSLTAVDATGNLSAPIALPITSNPNLAFPPDGQPSSITVATGDAQRGLVSTELPRPLIAIVRDNSGNPVPNTTVRFAVTYGAGRFINGNDTVNVQSDSDGYASASYVSGAAPGIQLVRANFTGNIMSPTTFMTEAFTSTPGGVTSMSGTVRDLNLRALPNVLVRVGGQQARTGADGRFRIENVSAGPHQVLELIGRDQIPLPGRWPNISYDIDVLPGIDNNLGRQLYLPKVNEGVPIPLNTSNEVTQNTSVQLPAVGGEPPIVITARAGTHVTFPPDVTDKRLSVTRIPASRVPMPLEDGLSTNLFISVQPSGAVFDQPLEVSFPNLDHLAPNTEVLLMSFDHDAGRYVKVGTGSVSPDGRTITSDPGSGIRVGAWHAFPARPGGPGNPPNNEWTLLGQIQIEGDPEMELVHLDEVLASAGGNRGIVLTDRAQWHSVAFLTARVRGNSPPGGPPPPAAIDVEVQKTTPEFELEEVSFADNYPLKSDNGQITYKKPHWKKTAPDQGFPVAYKAGNGDKIKLTAKFSVNTEITDGKALRVKATSNHNYALAPAIAELKKDGNSVSVVVKDTPAVSDPFPTDTIDYFESMDFTWEVSRDAGQTWSTSGTSKNRMYVTINKPSQAFHTKVHLATKNLKGLTKGNKAEIISRIWTEFSVRSVCYVTSTTCSANNALKYWGPITAQNPEESKSEYFSTEGLFKNGDGRCGAWQSFFIDALKVQGINGEQFNIVPIPKPGYPSPDAITTLDVQPVPAQGNPTPLRSFSNHALVLIGNDLYDPSYGSGPFTGPNDDERLKKWEDASLFQVRYFRNKADQSPLIVPNSPALETKRSLPPIGVPEGP